MRRPARWPRRHLGRARRSRSSPWCKRRRGVEHGIEALGQLLLFGDAEGDAGVPDAGLGADEPLAHRRGRDEEGGRDVDGRHAKDGLQDQRGAHAALDGGMGAGEHQREAAVRDFGRGSGGGDLVGDELHVFLPGPAGHPAAGGVGLAAAGDGQQPGIGIVGHAVGGPHAQSRREGFSQCILGARDVARAGGEEGTSRP